MLASKNKTKQIMLLLIVTSPKLLGFLIAHNRIESCNDKRLSRLLYKVKLQFQVLGNVSESLRIPTYTILQELLVTNAYVASITINIQNASPLKLINTYSFCQFDIFYCFPPMLYQGQFFLCLEVFQLQDEFISDKFWIVWKRIHLFNDLHIMFRKNLDLERIYRKSSCIEF